MERIDDLQTHNLKLIQESDEFCFGCDAVELANFVSTFKGDHAVDLGAGAGIIAVLLSGKRGIKTTAVEINPRLADLCKRNAAINNLEPLMSVLNLPMQQLPQVMQRGSCSVVVTNPPYFKLGSGQMRSGGAAAARHETSVTLSEVLDTAAYLLPTGGRFFVCYPTDRMAELLSGCTSRLLEPKELVILSAKGKDPHLCLLKAVKDGKTGLKVTARDIKEYGMD